MKLPGSNLKKANLRNNLSASENIFRQSASCKNVFSRFSKK